MPPVSAGAGAAASGSRRFAGWKSRTGATLAYLATLAGLVLVSVTSTSGTAIPISRPEGRVVVAPGLAGALAVPPAAPELIGSNP
jgi:hypothetical protein